MQNVAYWSPRDKKEEEISNQCRIHSHWKEFEEFFPKTTYIMEGIGWMNSCHEEGCSRTLRADIEATDPARFQLDSGHVTCSSETGPCYMMLKKRQTNKVVTER
eukprot:gene26493-biopygen3690